jgi:hypothetical protein
MQLCMETGGLGRPTLTPTERTVGRHIFLPFKNDMADTEKLDAFALLHG